MRIAKMIIYDKPIFFYINLAIIILFNIIKLQTFFFLIHKSL